MRGREKEKSWSETGLCDVGNGVVLVEEGGVISEFFGSHGPGKEEDEKCDVVDV